MSTDRHLLVPAYFYPNSESLDWKRLLAISCEIGEKLVVIANPESGPGEKSNSDYMEVLKKLKSNHAKIIGYVHTCWGLGKDCDGWKCKNDWIQSGINRLLPEIKEEIEAWVQLYPNLVDGFFFDEVSVDADKVAFYKKLQKSASAVIDNPICCYNYGMTPDSRYFSISNSIHCILEQRYHASPKDHWMGFKKWMPSFNSSNTDSAILLHACPKEHWQDAWKKIKKQNIPYIYITDAEGDNPWNRLPVFFEDFAKVIAKKNGFLSTWF